LSAWAGAVERRRLLLISLLVLTAANLLAALASSLPWLLGARVLAAVGAALYTPTASAVAATLAAAQYRGRALAVVTTGLTAATILGVPLGILIGAWISWQATLVFVALLSALALRGADIYCMGSGGLGAPVQQHRLISFAPDSAGIVLSLNSSAI